MRKEELVNAVNGLCLNKESKEKIISRAKSVRNEKECIHMSRKKVMALLIAAVLSLTGVFATVNAATNGKLVEKVKDTIQVIFTNEDGKEEKVEGTTYTDSNNHTIEKYQTEKNGTEYTVEVDKNTVNDEKLTVEGNINEEGLDITIGNN